MPFKGRTDTELLQTIANFKTMHYDQPILRHRSIGSIDFIRKLMHVDPAQRPTAEKHGHHSWLCNLGMYTIDKDVIKRSLACFRRYKTVGALQKKVIEYIVLNMFTDREADTYRKIFFSINKTTDGMCTK